MTDFADIAPTLLDMAGVAPPTNTVFDGGFLPFLTAKTDTHREWIYAYTGPVQVVRTKPIFLKRSHHSTENQMGVLLYKQFPLRP